MKCTLRRSVGAVALSAALLAHAPLVGQELPTTRPEAVGMSTERLDRVTAALERYVDEGSVAGAVALVLRRGSVAYLEAVGHRDREAADPMSTDDIFRIASQTKAIVSVGIMMLQEDGALLISDPVADHLPSFASTTVAVPSAGGAYDVVPARRPMTIRDLLTHTAGVSYGDGPAEDLWVEAGITGWYLADREEPVRLTVDRMAALPFAAHPGERWVYGYATDILGAVIESASGRTLADFLRERVFEPLDMRDTYFFLPPEERDRLATVYNRRRSGPLERAPDGAGMQTQGQYVDGPRSSYSGGAGLLSTARDYGRFLQMLLDGGRLGGTRLLSRASVDLMTTNHVGDLYTPPGMGFGLGFSIRTDVGAAGQPGSVGEFGWGGAYHSTYWVDPVEELVVAYFTQVIPAAGLDDFQRLRALVYAALTDDGDGRR